MDFKNILKKFNNKYIIVTLIFAVFLIFIDQYNVFNQIKTYKKLKESEKKVEFYEKEIDEQKKLLHDLKKDTLLMEKIAREEYMMKRDNEVIYLMEDKEQD